MDEFEKGYKNAIYQHSHGYSTEQGKEYVSAIKKEIDNLNESINQYEGYKTPSDRLKGNVAEQEQAGTYNINAAVKEEINRMEVPQSNKLASPDVQSNDGKTSAGLKYYKSTEETLRQQSKTYGERYEEYKRKSGNDISYEEYLEMNHIDKNTSPDTHLYQGQQLIIPREQFEELKKLLEENPELKEKYKNVIDSISDRIKSNDVESEPLTTEEAIQLAELAKEGDFDIEKFNKNFALKNVVEFSDILRKSAKSAISAATISVILDTIPTIYDIISNQLKGENIDSDVFLEKGFDCISVGGRAFIRGYISAFVSVGCFSGKFGSALQNIHPDAIAVVTVVMMNAIENGFKVYKGQMEKEELVDAVLRDTFSSCGYVLGVSIGKMTSVAIIKAIGTTMFGFIPVVGIFVGGIVGSMVGSFVYEKASNFVMAACVKKGYTLFGLVKQDYTLPIEIAQEIHEIVDIEQFEPDIVNIKQFEPDTIDIPRFEPEMVKIKLIKRGVISVGRVGYV